MQLLDWGRLGALDTSRGSSTRAVSTWLAARCLVDSDCCPGFHDLFGRSIWCGRIARRVMRRSGAGLAVRGVLPLPAVVPFACAIARASRSFAARMRALRSSTEAFGFEDVGFDFLFLTSTLQSLTSSNEACRGHASTAAARRRGAQLPSAWRRADESVRASRINPRTYLCLRQCLDRSAAKA